METAEPSKSSETMEWPGTAVAGLDSKDYDGLCQALEGLQPGGTRGGPWTTLMAFLGLLKITSSTNLRVGYRVGDKFKGKAPTSAALVGAGQPFNLTLRQLFLPRLPFDQSTIKMAWNATHWFDDKNSSSVAHITSSDASPRGPAAVVGIPVFRGLNIREELVLHVSLYAMADRQNQPILDLLQSETLAKGLSLGASYNPVFASTVPLIKATLKGLLQGSRRNFKLADWSVGLSMAKEAPKPLCFGEYVLLDGTLAGRPDGEPLDWSKLKWNSDTESLQYEGSMLLQPSLMFTITESSTDTNLSEEEPAIPVQVESTQ